MVLLKYGTAKKVGYSTLFNLIQIQQSSADKETTLYLVDQTR